MINLSLAGHVLAIDNNFPKLEEICRDYICEGEPKAVFSVTQKEIEEMSHCLGDCPDLEECECRAVHKKVCRFLIQKDVIGFHASVFEYKGKAVLITAPSGTGKSTHSRLWLKRFGDQVTVINADKPFIAFKEDKAMYAYGSPWCGKEWRQTNTCAPLVAIVVIHQASENTLVPLDKSDAYSKLIKQAYIPKEFLLLLKATDLVNRMCQLPVYSLGCTISQEAVTLVHDAVFGDET